MIQFASGVWNEAQSRYPYKEKEVLAALKAILKFRVHILNTHFTLRTDCPSLKGVLEKDAKDLAAKLIFARWQAMFSLFSFDIEHNKGESNSLPDFLTREYLQGGTGRISMMRTARKKTEWFPTTGDYDRYLDQTTSRASHGQQQIISLAGCLRRRIILDGLDESGEFPKNDRCGVCQAPLRRPREHFAFGMYSKGPI